MAAAQYWFTARRHGDLGSLAERGPAGPSAAMEARRRAIVDRPWTWLRQVHGARVVDVTVPGEHAGAEADAAVTAHPGAALAIFTADCAPIAFTSGEGVVGVAHAGWRGLAAGVVGATVDAMRAKGATNIEARLGPCIHPECYEFSPRDLDEVAARLGDHVRSRTADGRPALDLPAAVLGALAAAGVDAGTGDDAMSCSRCTACTRLPSGQPAWFSHRARAEAERQALVLWRT